MSQFHYDLLLHMINRDLHSPKSQIPFNDHWERLSTYIINVLLFKLTLVQVSYQYDFSDKTKELAILLFKHLQILQEVEEPEMQLYALLSISLASKLEEQRIFGIKNVLCETRFEKDHFEILQKEQFLLQILSCKLNLITPLDLIKSLLHFSNNHYDFTQIVDQCSNFVFLCLIDKDLVRFDASIIAVSSILIALDYLKMPNFKSQLQELVHSYFSLIDQVTVSKCIDEMYIKIKECQGSSHSRLSIGSDRSVLSKINSANKHKKSNSDRSTDQSNEQVPTEASPHGLPSSNSLLKYVQEFALINNLNRPMGDQFEDPQSSITDSFADVPDENLFKSINFSETLVKYSRPTNSISQIDKLFKELNIQKNDKHIMTTVSNESEEQVVEEEEKELAYSIVTDQQEIIKDQEVYRQIRYQNVGQDSGRSIKQSLISYISSFGINDERQFNDYNIIIAPHVIYASNHHFEYNQSDIRRESKPQIANHLKPGKV